MTSGKSGQVFVKKIVQLLASLFLLILGYECMVEAFHRLNEPSDAAVYAGTALLALLALLLPVLLWRLWRL